MSKVFRGFLGILALLPAGYIGFFIVGWFCNLVVLFLVEGPPFGYFYYHRMILWRLFLLSVFLAAVLIVAAMACVLATNKFNDDTKAAWLLGLLIGNIATLPLYWYKNIWREPRIRLASAAQQIVGRERRERVS